MSVSKTESSKSRSESPHVEEKEEIVAAAKEGKVEPTEFEGLGERDDVPKGKRRNLLEARVRTIRPVK